MSKVIKKPLIKKVKSEPENAVDSLNTALAPFAVKLNKNNEITSDISSDFTFEGMTLKQIQAASQRAINVLVKADETYMNNLVSSKCSSEAVTPHWFARRLAIKTKNEYGVDISINDFENLITSIYEEMAELLLNGRSIEILPIGTLRVSSRFRKSPIQGIPNVDNWFEAKVRLEPNRRFTNTLKVYELTRRTPEERELYKNALLELKFYQEGTFKEHNPNVRMVHQLLMNH